MANKSGSNGNGITLRKIVNMTAFIGICLIALVLLLRLIFGSIQGDFATVVHALQIVGEVIAYFVTAFCGFFFVRNKKNIAWAIVYAISVTAIIVLMFFV